MADRLQLYQYKGNQCLNCGKSVAEMIERYGTVKRMFDFHHVNEAEKHPQYTNLIRRVISADQLDEIDKCILLCGGCHDILHAQSVNCSVNITVNADDLTATQTLTGQVIVDLIDKRATFLCNEHVFVVPYRVQLRGEAPKTYFGTSLRNEGVLIQLMRDIATHRKFRIMDFSETQDLLVVEHLHGDNIRVSMHVSFPILTSELCGETGDKPFVWIRNGVCLTKDGKVIQDGWLNFDGEVTPLGLRA